MAIDTALASSVPVTAACRCGVLHLPHRAPQPVLAGLQGTLGCPKGLTTGPATCPTHRCGHVAGCSLPSRLHQWVWQALRSNAATFSYIQLQATATRHGCPRNLNPGRGVCVARMGCNLEVIVCPRYPRVLCARGIKDMRPGQTCPGRGFCGVAGARAL